MSEILVLVDQFGHRTGVAERSLCHQGEGLRHRAFVIFLVSTKGEILVQRRAGNKLGGNSWDVSATSHVRADENYGPAIQRCLKRELGITELVNPRYRLSYDYQNQLGDSAENEYCSVFMINYDGDIIENKQEMDETRWVLIDDLKSWFQQDESQFTKWFSDAFHRLMMV